MFEILKMAQCLQDPKRKIRVKTFLLTLILNVNIAILSLSCIYINFVSSAIVKEILFALLTGYIYKPQSKWQKNRNKNKSIYFKVLLY